MSRLLSIDEAADRLNVPTSSLKTVLDRHPQFRIKMGRAVRISTDDLGDIVEACREKPKAPGSTGGKHPGAEKASGSSSTPASPSGRPAQAIGAKLTSRSLPTSQKGKGGQLVHLRGTN